MTCPLIEEAISFCNFLHLFYMKTTLAPHSIYAESTPNPATMKFVSNRYLVVTGDSYEFNLDSDLSASPLAQRLLNFAFIESVFISSNFVTLTKTQIVDWEDIIPEMREFISQSLNSGVEVITTSAKTTEKETGSHSTTITPSSVRHNLEGIDAQIADILEQYVKPSVEMDGGAIDFDSFEDGVVRVILRGACSGCPSSTMTLKAGIENILKEMLPEVQEVEALNG